MKFQWHIGEETRRVGMFRSDPSQSVFIAEFFQNNFKFVRKEFTLMITSQEGIAKYVVRNVIFSVFDPVRY